MTNLATDFSVNNCVLFLDFDGVTHPEPSRKADEFCALPLIEEVLRDCPEVEVVISSSWRTVFSLEQLRGFFSDDVARRVVGVTPSSKKASDAWLPSGSVGFERESECNTWMRQNRSWDTPWVAIDDRAHWFREDCSELLLTDSKTGFQVADQKLLRQMIAERA
jgi:hypothetical protein